MAILDEIKREIEANKNRVYRFWFSAKQKASIQRMKMGRNPYHPNFVTINGKRHEYTECMSSEHFNEKCNWDDAVYLGETTWRNIS